jgi:tetratricopeptide (TPR) repeat protein
MSSAPSTPGLLEGRPRFTRWLERATPWLIAALVIAVYLPSIPGDFLTYDDPWLVENNPILRLPIGAALRSILFDLRFPTRLALGAEYLPLRDVSYWIDRALGFGAPAMRAEQVLIYLAAVLLLRAALLLNLRSRVAAEIATLCFALHPVHVESVAWIAGRKDVLSLFFITAALRAYEAKGRRGWAAVPLLLAAYFCKSMSVVACGLLLAQDLIARRRPRWGVLSVCTLLAVLSIELHGIVGARVAMLSGPLSGDRAATWRTMGHVWLQYLEVLVWPPKLALMHEVPRQATWDLASVCGWALIAAGALVGVLWLRRGKPLALACWLWMVVPLVPVSQVLFPLQNVMADRYLWLSVLGVGLLLAKLWQLGRLGVWGVSAALGVWAAASAWRADAFADGVVLFTRETRLSRGPAAPVGLAEAYMRRADFDGAERAYRLALERPYEPSCAQNLRASNGLALLLVHEGRPADAEPVLRAARIRFPNDPDVAFNLVKVLYRLGQVEEARALFEEVHARFPNYRSNDGVGSESQSSPSMALRVPHPAARGGSP